MKTAENVSTLYGYKQKVVLTETKLFYRAQR